jgi:hypothetical protein
MVTITIFVGDVSEDLASAAKSADPTARLITKQDSTLAAGTYYVSIGDLENLSQFARMLRQASHIVYVCPDQWSDGDRDSSRMKKWTEDYLSVFSCDHRKVITGYQPVANDLEAMTRLVDQRRGSEPQIWIAGCSISNGVGVDEHQRYGKLIAAQLSMPVSFLTQNCSSIPWAADQILRSDIRPGDTVFWGITGVNRFSYWNDSEKNISHCTLSMYKYDSFMQAMTKESFLISDHMIYHAVNSVRQVVNFCHKVNTKLVIATLIRGMETFLAGIPNFIPLAGIHGRDRHDMFIDVGTDDQHPGPRSHQYYADQMLEKYHHIQGTTPQ